MPARVLSETGQALSENELAFARGLTNILTISGLEGGTGIGAESYPKLFPMLKDNFRIAWRNLLKNRTSSIVNISGLAVGIAVAVLTGLWLYDELSFNTYHDNYERIAKVALKGVDPHHGGFISPVLSYPLAHELREKYKGDFRRMVTATWPIEQIVSSGDKQLSTNGQYMEPEAPDLFSLKMVSGSRAGLSEMHSVLLAQSVAAALFGNSDPVGKIVRLGDAEVKVTGVFEDLPLNTDLHKIRYISPFSLWLSQNDWVEKNTSTEWFNHYLRMYVEIKPGTSFASVGRRIKDIEMTGAQHIDDANTRSELSTHPEVVLYPMPKWHLEAADQHRHDSDIDPGRLVWLVGLIGAFVLILACINFMNLSTARSERRAREVGIRKAVGSLRRQLITQFFGESLVMVAVAFVVALLLTSVSLGWFNQLAAKQMSIPWASPWFWLVSIVFVFLTGVIAGSYPALYLSSFNPVKALKGARLGAESVIPRKVLVVLQFTISVALINCTIIILQQVQHAKDRPVGYDREGLLMMSMRGGEVYARRDLIRSQLLRTGVVEECAESMGKVTELASNNGGFDWAGRDPNKEQNYGTIAVSPEYGKAVGWQFVRGRDFDRGSALDSSGMVINESAMKEMGLKDPVGTDVTWTWWMDKTQVLHYKIIGVIKDMVVESPYAPTKPTVYYLKGLNGGYSWMEIKVRPGAVMSQALLKIGAVMRQLVPSVPFDYQFVDEDYAQKFALEDRMSKLAGLFSALAVFISCLGLFGLASYTAEQRTREVGIRKVLGASVAGVWRLLSKEFVVLVGIALVIAMPVAWYFMSHWLQDYSYRITISAGVFIASGAGALLISLVTVSWQAIRAAMANPVKSLRTE